MIPAAHRGDKPADPDTRGATTLTRLRNPRPLEERNLPAAKPADLRDPYVFGTCKQEKSPARRRYPLGFYTPAPIIIAPRRSDAPASNDTC